jgi:hypothetical protein
MGRASSAKKVHRAQRVGGSSAASARGRKVGFPAAMAAIIIVGVVFVVFARAQRTGSDVAPQINEDHWHSAFGIYACDEYLPNVTDVGEDQLGIHTHEDGLIHIHPFSSLASGENATLGVFADQIGLELGDDSFTTPTGETFTTGDDCNGVEGVVQVLRWPSGDFEAEPEVITGDLADIRLLADGEAYALVFRDPDEEVPLPPALASLNAPTDLAPGETVPEFDIPLDELGDAPGAPTTVVAEDGVVELDGGGAPATTGAP